ncbi:MAG: SDR family oxidoreductase [Anaerolineales bacterium]|nr:SDR family oxidoreductase [Anaerolineales bacterium]MDW8276726.1 SDR family oxidoreductase [Anaerolineales bacterium]
MTNYLVTGGAGFIGSHIVGALLQQGGFVRVLDNFSTGKWENVTPLVNSRQAEIIEGDIRDPETVARAMQDIEYVFHEAAFVSVPQSMEDPLPCFDINQRGTEIVLEAARKAGVRRVVLASSAAVYGDSDALPLAEESPLRPLSPYAVSKRVDELYAELYTRSFGLEVVALRYFNVYGPRQRPDSMYAAAVPIFTRRLLDGKSVTIYGDGGQTRDLVYVGDVVRANLLASQHPAAPGQVFNVCTGQELRVIDLVETLMRLFPHAPAPQFAPPRAGDIYRSVGNPHKAAEWLGFRAQTPLEEGLQAVVEHMRNAY